MLRQIVLHTFLSGIYTMPLPSCLHLHITIALLPPPTVVQHSLQLICWPSSEAELMTGQRMVEKNDYKIVALCVCVCFCVCVCERGTVLCPFPIQPTPCFARKNCIFTVHPDIMEIGCLWNLQMKLYIHKSHYKKTPNTLMSVMGNGSGESLWIITLWFKCTERISSASTRHINETKR